MFQSGVRRSKTPTRYCYLSRSLPKPCKEQMRKPHHMSNVSVSIDLDRPSITKEVNRSQSSAKLSVQGRRKPSFVSVYSTKSRFDSIMSLKSNTSSSKQKREKSGFSFENLSKESDKENVRKQPESRLQKIMNINVIKPQVVSTLKNYQPQKKQKPPIKPRKVDDDLQVRKQSKQKIKRANKQEEKQNMLWRSFQRERERRVKENKVEEQKQYRKQRSIEKRFQSKIQKQLKRIQSQNQINMRKSKAFSPFFYPLF